MLLSVLYFAFQSTLQFLFLRFQSTASKDLEIVVLRHHSVIAVDFVTVDTVWLQRLYVLFFIELGSLAGCCTSTCAQHKRDRVCAPYGLAAQINAPGPSESGERQRGRDADLV